MILDHLVEGGEEVDFSGPELKGSLEWVNKASCTEEARYALLGVNLHKGEVFGSSLRIEQEGRLAITMLIRQ